MDADYILPKLKGWAELFYKGKCFSKKKGKYYIFGNEEVENKITSEVAMYICVGKIPKKKKK